MGNEQSTPALQLQAPAPVSAPSVNARHHVSVRTSYKPPPQRLANPVAADDQGLLPLNDDLSSDPRWSHLCQRCRNLKVHGTASDLTHDHHRTVPRELEMGRQRGCTLCRMMMMKGSPNYAAWWIEPETKLDARNTALHYVEYFSSPMGYFVFSAELGDPAAEVIARRPPITRYNSEAAYTRIRNWMSDCCGVVDTPGGIYNHTNCESLTPKLLPKRLIGVGSAEKEPFLVEPDQGSVGLYVALSYCWGRSQPITLTREKLKTGLPLFPIQQLPATLRDAIMICRELKFQYVWIDALCIIQDSLNGEDWIIESGKMNDIYGNAALTIAATAAKDTSQGILDRFPLGLELETCAIPYHLADGRVGKALLHFHSNETMKNEVLGTRAWALQEYLLSPRILSYQSNQLVWECKQGKQNANTPTDSHKSPREGEWNEIIAGFTGREMTNSTDRLAAISGYAKFTSLKTSVNASLPAPRYLAGLWSTTLATDLLWYANEYPKNPRPAVYRAPSWSWAAIDGGVHFEPSAPHDPSINPDILAAVVYPDPHNPFGSIPSPAAKPSFLRLRARLRSTAGLLIEPLLRAHAQPGAGPPPSISVDFASGTRPDGHSSFSLSFDTLDDAAIAATFYLAINAVGRLGGLYRVFTAQSPLALLQMTQRQALVVVLLGQTSSVEGNGFLVRRVGFLNAIYRTVGTFGPWFDIVGPKSLVTVI